MRYSFLAFALCMSCSFGCNTATTPDQAVKLNIDSSPAASLKSILNGIAETGEIGSAELMIQDELARFKKEDEAKASTIEKEIQGLVKLKSSAQIKEKAAQIAGQL